MKIATLFLILVGCLVQCASAQGQGLPELAGRWSGKSRPDSSGLVYYIDLTLLPDGRFSQSLQGESFNTHRMLPRHTDAGQWRIVQGTVVLTYVNRGGQEVVNRWTIEGRTLVANRLGFQFTLLRR